MQRLMITCMESISGGGLEPLVLLSQLCHPQVAISNPQCNSFELELHILLQYISMYQI